MFFFTSGYQMTNERAHEDLEESDYYIRADLEKVDAVTNEYKANEMN